jgi:thiazole/oxazole-forming peptide maturase SagD family component
MDLSLVASASPLPPAVQVLMDRMVCPLTGLAQTVGFARRGILEPRVGVAGGDMTGVHVLANRHAPREGAYHIGGSGTTYEEMVIRTLGETIERYAQFLPAQRGQHQVLMATQEELRAAGKRVAATEPWQFFTPAQLGRAGFPFVSLPAETPIGWVACPSLSEDGEWWVPAQQALVGYVRSDGEPPYMAGVTTGTAAHTRLADGTLNALLELVQIDAAVGHWYGAAAAVGIRGDARTRALDRLLESRLRSGGPSPRFFWLPSADLPGFAIACVLESADLPRFAVGLGCDLRLSRAMYKAFLEGAAVAQLAKVILFRQASAGVERPGDADPEAIFDLDSNVAYYAVHGDEAAIERKFGNVDVLAAGELPPDGDGPPAEEVRRLVDGFRATGKRLVFLDLTTADVRELGFCVVRLWSPDLLSLPLPSAPPLAHPRFAAYGGAVYEAPHPYP